MLTLRLVYILLCGLFCFAPPGYALQINNVSPIITPDDDSVELTLDNNLPQASFISVKIHEVSAPTIDGVPVSNGTEIISSKNRFILSAQQKMPIVLQYQGPPDNKERYYRVTWYQEVIQKKDAPERLIKPIELDTLLVVNPREDHFRYLYQGGKLINSGNSSFKVTAYGKCRQPSSQRWCSQQSYLMPGWKTRFQQIDLHAASSSITINYNNQLINVL